MNWLKFFVVGALAGVALVALRDPQGQGRLAPGGTRGALGPVDEEEPVLGYDGMDEETLLDWLDDAGADRDTLLRIREYEMQHLARDPVLDAIEDRL